MRQTVLTIPGAPRSTLNTCWRPWRALGCLIRIARWFLTPDFDEPTARILRREVIRIRCWML